MIILQNALILLHGRTFLYQIHGFYVSHVDNSVAFCYNTALGSIETGQAYEVLL